MFGVIVRNKVGPTTGRRPPLYPGIEHEEGGEGPYEPQWSELYSSEGFEAGGEEYGAYVYVWSRRSGNEESPGVDRVNKETGACDKHFITITGEGGSWLEENAVIVEREETPWLVWTNGSNVWAIPITAGTHEAEQVAEGLNFSKRFLATDGRYIYGGESGGDQKWLIRIDGHNWEAEEEWVHITDGGQGEEAFFGGGATKMMAANADYVWWSERTGNPVSFGRCKTDGTEVINDWLLLEGEGGEEATCMTANSTSFFCLHYQEGEEPNPKKVTRCDAGGSEATNIERNWVDINLEEIPESGYVYYISASDYAFYTFPQGTQEGLRVGRKTL